VGGDREPVGAVARGAEGVRGVVPPPVPLGGTESTSTTSLTRVKKSAADARQNRELDTFVEVAGAPLRRPGRAVTPGPRDRFVSLHRGLEARSLCAGLLPREGALSSGPSPAAETIRRIMGQ
jgi:hypothetical protein